jgi:hypothetical protein
MMNNHKTLLLLLLLFNNFFVNWKSHDSWPSKQAKDYFLFFILKFLLKKYLILYYFYFGKDNHEQGRVGFSKVLKIG